MVSLLLFRKLRRDLFRHKIALSALIAIVTLGVGSYVGMKGVYQDLESSRAQYYRDYRLADFVVSLKRAPEWTAGSVAGMPNVALARGRIKFPVLVDVPRQEEPISGAAISMPENRSPVLNDILLRTGTWFSGEGDKQAILNDQFAAANGLYPGSRIKVLLLDQQHELLVVGTAMSPEFVYLLSAEGGALVPDPEHFGVMYLPKTFLQESCDLEGAYNEIIGLAHDTSQAGLSFVLGAIEEKLDAYGVTSTLKGRDQPSVKYLADELTGLKVSATVIPGIVLGVAALVLNVLMGRIMVQQRTIIGTLKALGYSTWRVTRHYLGYGVAIGFVGGCSGVLFGRWVQVQMAKMYRQFFALPSIEPHVYPEILFIGVGISVLFACLGTLKGVRYAIALEPAEAMRPPPPEKGGKIPIEAIGFLWRPLPFRWKMMLRAVFRNPFRSSVSAFASAISAAVLLASFCQYEALDYIIDYEYNRLSHQDVTVSVRDPEGFGVQQEVARLPGVAGTEPQLSVGCDLRNGPYEKRAGVIGLVREPLLYTPLDEEGRAVEVPPSGLVLSEKLAEVLCLKRGDPILLRPLIGERREVRTCVADTVKTFLGLSAYADIEYLSRLLGEPWSANVVLTDTFSASAPSTLVRELKRRPEVLGIGHRSRAFMIIQKTLGETMGAMMAVMILFAGLIAFGSVLNTALVSLSERRREVGTLRVLGYMPGQVARVFSGESLLVNGIGIVFGLALGVGLVHLLAMAYSTELYRFPAVIYPSRMLWTGLIMIGFVSLAQIVVYQLVRALEWLEVVKTRE